MIRINLLGTVRSKARRGPVLDSARLVMLACSLILVASAAAIGGWYWSLTQASAQVDADLAAVLQESARLRSIMAEVQRFELRRQQLQQRVALIEQLRVGQSVPVQMLDAVSRSLPDLLWLTDLKQQGADVTLQGRSLTLIALSDFVGNLGARDLFRKPIEIVDSQVEPSATGAANGPPAEVIKFTVKAQIATPPAVGAPTADAPPQSTGVPAPGAPRR